MTAAPTPIGLLRQQIVSIRGQLPGIMNGQPDAIHDARIATRRVREILPLVVKWHGRDEVHDMYKRFRLIGRSLGEVRDADVQIALLGHLESRIPHLAPSLVVVRQAREHQRVALMRKLIKRIERTELQDLLRAALDLRSPSRGLWGGRSARWKPGLRTTIVERARAAAAAVEYATGVYFPNRAHAVRITLKKLRYALEIAQATGGGEQTPAIRDLKKGQDVLGDLHDRQALVDELTTAPSPEHPNAAEHLSLVAQVFDAEIRDLHQTYLARRDRLVEICREALVVAGLALTSGLLVAGRRCAAVHGR